MAKKKKRGFKRIVTVNDLHCGSRVGMTPAEWQGNPNNTEDEPWVRIQQAQWKWYNAIMASLYPIDIGFVLGDIVDGKQSKNDGRDSIRTKRSAQVSMATQCLKVLKAEKYFMVYGSRYHVRDWEEDVCDGIDGASLKSHSFVEIECEKGKNVTFDLKHKVGRSSIPHGRATAPARENLWNLINSGIGKEPNADFILRGHVHYFHAQKSLGSWIITCPSLQGFGSEYGMENFNDAIDFGIMCFDVYDDGSVEWGEKIAVLPENTHKALKA